MTCFPDNLAKVFDFFSDERIEGYEYNTATTRNLIAAADAVCDVTLTEEQAQHLLTAIKQHALAQCDNEKWHVRQTLLDTAGVA